MPTETEPKAKPPPKEASFIVVHVNPSGHHFATRVKALDEEGAGHVIMNAHTDNRFVHVYMDRGEKTIDYDGQTLTVNTLDEEP